MPKKGKGRGKQTSVEVPVYDSDDERKYKGEKVPDPTSDDYYHDEVDEFHSKRDKILLDRGVKDDDDGLDSDNEDEVLGLGLDDDDDDLLSDEDIQIYKKQLRRFKQTRTKDEMGSDIEDEEKGLPDTKAWGKKRSKYYGGDVDDDDIDVSGSEEEEGTAALEEKEALALQRRLAEELDDADLGLDEIIKPSKKEKKGKEGGEKIVKDLSKLSKKEKLQLLQKESPEMMSLIDDFKLKMTEVKDIYQPLMDLVRAGKITGKAADYVDAKFSLYLNYCTNICFYMVLKSKRMPVQNHPVIKRLLQYRNLIKQLEPVDEYVHDDVQELVRKLKAGEDIDFIQEPVQPTPDKFVRRKSLKGTARQRAEKKKISEMVVDSDEENQTSSKKKKKEEKYETMEEKAALAYYEMMKDGRRKGAADMDDDDDNELMIGEAGEVDIVVDDMDASDEEGKRAVTYQIEKNKGILPQKKKELKNPRVKHRMKYRKAKIRRKGQVREARTEMHRYGGETSGIRAGIKRSIKLKI